MNVTRGQAVALPVSIVIGIFHPVIQLFYMFPEIVRLTQLAVFKIPMTIAGLVKFEVGAPGKVPEGRRLTVNKFSAEFNRKRELRTLPGEDAAPDSIACFKHDRLVAGNAKVARSGQTSRAGANDNDAGIFHAASFSQQNFK